MNDTCDSKPLGYFDLNKTAKELKRQLETEEDYHRAASSCFDSADSFLRTVCLPMLLGRLEDVFCSAAFASASFSCELFLKTLLLAQCETPGKLNNLDELFAKIEADSRESVLSSFPMGPGTHTRDRDEFMLQLHENRDAFPIIRYCYELTSYTFQYEYVFNLALTLREEARRKLKSLSISKPEEIIRI